VRASLGAEHAPVLPDWLSAVPAKRALFAVDTHFRESWEDLTALGGAARELAHRHALVLLKPDAVAARKLEPTLCWLAEQQAVVVAAERGRLCRHQTRAMWRYQWNVATRDRRDLADLLVAAGESLLLVVRLPDGPVPAAVRLSNRKGPADPGRRRPWQLRHRLGGGNYLINFVHVADEPADLVRELGVLCGHMDRRRVYRAMLDGADRSAQAREQVARLYRNTPERDLGLDGVIHRLKRRLDGADRSGARGGDPAAADELAAALARMEAGPPADWRGIRPLAERAGLAMHPWDEIVLGTSLMVASEPGTAPVLSDVPEEAWAGQPGGAAPSGPVTGPMLRHDRTLPRELVHKAGTGEVFVTDSAALGPDEMLVAGELPTAHDYFNDTPGRIARWDLVPVMEVCRQAIYVVAHRHLGVPARHTFLLRGLRGWLGSGGAFRPLRVPQRVLLTCRVRRRVERSGGLVGAELGFTVSTVDGVSLAGCDASVSWTAEEDWHSSRSGTRAALGLPAAISHAARPSGTIPSARHVGRGRDRNVLLVDPACQGRRFHAGVAVDPGNHSMFEHDQDHLPGMTEVEAARQAAVWAVGRAADVIPEALAVARIDARFSSVGELDLPIRAEGRLERVTAVGGTATVELCQGDRRLSRSMVDLAARRTGEAP
jgi:hypothetical protein